MPPLLFDKLKRYCCEDQLAIDEKNATSSKQITSDDKYLLPLLVFSRSTFCSLTPRLMSDRFHINSKLLHLVVDNNIDTFQFSTSLSLAVDNSTELRVIREKIFPEAPSAFYLIRYLQHVSLGLRTNTSWRADYMYEEQYWSSLLAKNPYYHSSLISFSSPGQVATFSILEQLLRHHPSDEVRVSCVKSILSKSAELLDDGRSFDRCDELSILIHEILLKKNVASFEHASWYATLLAHCVGGYFATDYEDNEYYYQAADTQRARDLLRRTLEGFEVILTRRGGNNNNNKNRNRKIIKKKGENDDDDTPEIRMAKAIGKVFLFHGVLNAYNAGPIREEMVSILISRLEQDDDEEENNGHDGDSSTSSPALRVLREMFFYIRDETQEFFDAVESSKNEPASSSSTYSVYSSTNHYFQEEKYCDFFSYLLDAAPQRMSNIFLHDLKLVDFIKDLLDFAKKQTLSKSRKYDMYKYVNPDGMHFVGKLVLKFVSVIMNNNTVGCSDDLKNISSSFTEHGKKTLKEVLKAIITETRVVEDLCFKYIILGYPKRGQSRDWTPLLCSLGQEHLKFLSNVVNFLTNPQVLEEGDDAWLEFHLFRCFDNNKNCIFKVRNGVTQFCEEGCIFDVFLQSFPKPAFSMRPSTREVAIQAMGNMLVYYENLIKQKRAEGKNFDYDALINFVKKKYAGGCLCDDPNVVQDGNFKRFVA